MQPKRRKMHSAESTPILAGIIKVFWTALSELWLHHLAHIHRQSDTAVSPVTTDELHNKVRWMHTFQAQLHETHPHYFQENLEDFLQTSKPAALQTYVSQYAPAIQTALDQASVTDTASTSTTTSQLTQTSSAQVIPEVFPTRREPAHRKRNRRRKVMTGITHSLRQWLRPNPS